MNCIYEFHLRSGLSLSGTRSPGENTHSSPLVKVLDKIQKRGYDSPNAWILSFLHVLLNTKFVLCCEIFFYVPDHFLDFWVLSAFINHYPIALFFVLCWFHLFQIYRVGLVCVLITIKWVNLFSVPCGSCQRTFLCEDYFKYEKGIIYWKVPMRPEENEEVSSTHH